MLQSVRSRQVLLSVNQPSGATAQTGASYQVKPVLQDGVADENQQFTFGSSVQANGGSGSSPAPGCQCVIEGSFDNVTWFAIANGTVRAANDVTNQEQMAEVSNARVPPYIRARTILTAETTNPTKQVVTAWITSSGDFTLTAA